MLSGNVIRYGQQIDRNGNPAGLGNFVVVKLDNGTSLVYGHLASIDSNIVVGSSVPQGTILGVTGNTGKSTGIHSHISWLTQDATDTIVGATSGVGPKIGLGVGLNQNTVMDPTSFIQKALPLSHIELKLKNYTPDPNLNQPKSLEQLIKELQLSGSLEDSDMIKTISKTNKLSLEEISESSYIIQSGDTFFEIADRLIAEGKISSRQDLIDANTNIDDVNNINIGDEIIIPEKIGSNNYQVFKEDYSSFLQRASFVDANNSTAQLTNISFTVETQQESLSVFTVIKDGFFAVIDDTKIAVGTLLTSIESSLETTATFITSRAQEAYEIAINQITSDTLIDSLIGSIIADLILGEDDPSEIAKNLAEGQLKSLASAILDDSFKDLLKSFGMSESAISDLIGQPAAGYIVTGDGIKLAVDAAGNILPINSINATLYTAVLNFAISAADSGGWNSAEYAQSAKVAIASAVVTALVTTALTACFPGLGTAAGIVISAVINALVVGPLVNYVDNQYEVIENAFIIVRDITKDLLRDPINTLEDLSVEDLAEQAKELSIDLVENVGKFGRDVLIGAYNLIGQDYGKKYSAGQYENPYSFTQVTPKEDGSGNIIVGLEREGVVIQAAEGQNDDLFGTDGQDSLVGKSGQNTIYGYKGNDHIEGRGDDDILVGGEGNDEIFGGNGNDYLIGNEGDDQLEGGNGNDAILAGSGSDIIDGGKGDDQIEAEDGNDYVLGGDGDDIILGGQGNDIIDGGNGEDIILGEEGDDLILGGEGNDVIEGGEGNDIIKGQDGNDNLRGSDGDDTIYGNAGIDIIYGDAGVDVVDAGTEDDLVFGGIGNDVIYGNSGNDSLYGEIGNDYLIGGEGDDVLDGFTGDDVIYAGKGDDTIAGGEDNDSFIFFKNDGQDTINDTDETGSDVIKLADLSSTLSGTSTNRLVLTKDGDDLIIQFKDDVGEVTSDKITVKNQFVDEDSDGATLRIDRIEFSDGKKIELSGVVVAVDNTISYSTVAYTNIDTDIQTELASGYEDMLSINQDEINTNSSFYTNNYNTTADQDHIDNEKYNEVQWLAIKKTRSIFGGVYRVWKKYYEQNLNGTNGNDRIVGNWWSENINGGDGDDQLNGNDGNDTIHGDAGDDLIYGGGGQDNLYGDAGNDKIYGGTEVDNIDGGAGNDNLIGGSDADIILGQAGDDRLEGNDGNDNLDVGSGNNLVYGGSGNDAIVGNLGNDLLYGHDGDDTISGAAGDDYISGGSGNDVLNGGEGNDIILGDLGSDRINGGAGIDYIYGGKGVDVISGDDGEDVIYGGDGEDEISGGLGSDKIHGGAGFDNVKGDDGDDVIYGESEGDVLDGGTGDDQIFGGTGNDILIDGAGSDILDGGAEKDILILTKEEVSSSSIDVINNFNATEDKIILKVNYQNPITFAAIQEAMVQDGSDVEITLDNGQKIIITNTNKANISSSNFSIGLSGGAGNQILFGTSGDDVVMGDEGNDTIYGGEGNDELWGGLGSDALYGEGGDDILRYEADGKYNDSGTVTYSDETAAYWGYSHRYVHSAHYFNDLMRTYVYSPALGALVANTNINQNDDVIITGNYTINRVQSASYQISNTSSKSQYEAFPNNWVYGLYSVTQVNYRYGVEYRYATKNFHNSQLTDVTGYNKTADIFDGGSGYDVILMTEGNDLLALDDQVTDRDNPEAQRVKDIAVIYAGKGDDVVNFSTKKYTYQDLVVYGGEGDDKIWSNEGNDTLLGQEGDDEIYGGDGSDIVDGGDGVDNLYGGDGDDVIDGGDGDDKIYGGDGDDVLTGGIGFDTIDGGVGSDTISYANSTAAVTIDLANSIVSGGEGSGDILLNVENAIGSSYDDTITGSSYNNVITGKVGNDILIGGTGNDTYIYNIGDGSDNITESGYDVDTIEFGEGITAADLIFSDDGLNLIIQIGSDANDKIVISNQLSSETSSKIEYIKFADGKSVNIAIGLYISAEDSSVQLSALSIDQLLVGSVAIDNLSGGYSDDRIYGNGGNDDLKGDEGNDTIYGGDGNDSIYGNGKSLGLISRSLFDWQFYIKNNQDLSAITTDDAAWNHFVSYGRFENRSYNANSDLYRVGDDNKLCGEIGNDTIFGGYGNDELSGGSDNDNIFGNAGSDELKGGSGNDKLYGGTGKDVLYGDDGIDILRGDEGDDTLFGGLGTDNLIGGDGNDVIYGDDGSDIIQGGLGNDKLFGGEGNDDIRGEDGDDEITGGIGTNILSGGAGSDVYFYNIGDGDTTIKDYDILSSTVDKIKFGNGVTKDNLIFVKSSNDLLIFLTNSDYKIKIENQFLSSNNKLEYLVFSDSSILDLSSISYKQFDRITEGSSVSNTINKEGDISSGDLIFTGAGNDNIRSGGGSDLVMGGSGDDTIYGVTNNDIFASKVKVNSSVWSSFDKAPRQIGDINGDGKADILAFNLTAKNLTAFYGKSDGTFQSGVSLTSGLSYMLNLTGRADWASYSQNKSPFLLGDVNGDGADDIIQYNAYGGWDFISNKNGTFVEYDELSSFTYSSSSSYDVYPQKLADIDGNGTEEVFYFGNDGVYLEKRVNSSYTNYKVNDTLDNNSGWTSNNTKPRELADVNGDGKDDLIGFGTDGVYVALNQFSSQYNTTAFGTVFKASSDYGSLSGWSSQESTPRKIADVNGDGKADIIGFASDGVYVSYGKLNGAFDTKIKMSSDFGSGSGFTSYNTNPREVADVNGDGKADIITFANDGIYVSLSTKDNTSNVIYGGSGNDTIYGGVQNNKIYGEDGNDTIYGDAGNDVLFDGLGSDILDAGAGYDEINITKEGAGTSVIDAINNFSPSADIIVFNCGYSFSAIQALMVQEGNNVKITLDNGQKIIITNINKSVLNSSNFLTSNPSPITGASESFVADVNETMSFSIVNSSPEIAEVSVATLNIVVTASNGSATINQSLNGNSISYIPNPNFSGVDNILYQELDSSGNVLYSKSYSVFVAASNDAPIGNILDQEIKLEESFSIKLSDYFSDVDGDNLTYSLKLNGSSVIPDWIEFNQNTKTISGTAGKIEELNFEVTVSDGVGGMVSDQFKINVTKDTVKGISTIEELSNITPATLDLNLFKDAEYVAKQGGNFSENLIVNSGNALIKAGFGNDKITSSDDSDVLDGGEGDDIIKSGGGDDILIGNSGNDELEGGSENDIYIFNNNFGQDTVTDSDGKIIVNNAALSLSAIQQGESNSYDAGSYLLTLHDGNLLIASKADLASNQQNSITIESFSNGKFGINLNNNPNSNFTSSIVSEDQPTIIFDILSQAFDIDGDSIFTALILTSQNGLIEFDQLNGLAKYTPNKDFYGVDSFQYSLSDGKGGQIIKTVNIQVNSINDAPTITSTITNTSVSEDAANTIITAATIASSFSDVDGDILIYSATLEDGNSLPSWLSINSATGEVASNNTSNSDVGSYNIKIIATDPSLASISQSFVVTVNNINDAPIVTSITSTAIEDASSITLAFNGSDVDVGDVLTYAILTNPALGTIINNNDGTFSYDLGNNFQNLSLGQTQDVTFTYQATDLSGTNSNISTATITVTGTNDIPTASLITATTNEDNSIIIDVLTVASDIDASDILTISSITNASNGVVSITTNANGKQVISYAPSSNYNGTDKFNPDPSLTQIP